MLDMKAYTAGYSAGSNAAQFFDEHEIPNPRFDDNDSATYQKGWWDGFNKLEFDPVDRACFHTLSTNRAHIKNGGAGLDFPCG
jgi:hypothetical protein